MKIKFLATGMAPTHYSFSGDVVTAHYNGQGEGFDLSDLQHGDQFQGVSVDDLSLSPGHVIRKAERDSNGELHLTLCQRVGPGHWEEGAEIDVADYDPAKIQVVLNADKPYSGIAFAVTSEGKQWVK